MSFRWFIPPPSDGIPAGGFSPTFLIPCRGAECSGPVVNGGSAPKQISHKNFLSWLVADFSEGPISLASAWCRTFLKGAVSPVGAMLSHRPGHIIPLTRNVLSLLMVYFCLGFAAREPVGARIV
ncbi:hypothetical protein SAMN06265173_14825 [Thalassovita litoralis]|uniref:Uncharacterized protein n=1 Tax=Thalassovita litoralis TaxID=1010611 RepID=A0A521FS57_9RHOB|nr:hypothetical protein SAMN06265173_14825 [Thalassovita litoralis]